MIVRLVGLSLVLAVGVGAGGAMARDAGALEFDCVVDPARSVRVASPVRGILAEVLVDRGDEVALGQTIARLEASVEDATLALNRERAEDTSRVDAARERMKFAKKELDRALQMKASGVISAGAVDEVVTGFEVAQNEFRQSELEQRLARLELERSEAVLALRTVRSPVDGVVTAVELSGGEFVREDVEIMTVVELDPLHVETFVPQDRLGTISLGDRARVELSAPAGERHEAIVTVVDPVIDAASGTLGVRLELANPEKRLPAGIRCRVGFSMPGEELSETLD